LKKKELSAKQESFCYEYLKDKNATQAAIRAGYSKKTAHVQGPRLLDKVAIQSKLAELLANSNKRAEKTADDIRRELERVAFSDVKRVVSWNESGMAFLHDSDNIQDDDSAAIETIQATEDAIGTGADIETDSKKKKERARFVLKTKVKMHNKLKALELLGKEHGMFKDRVEVSGGLGLKLDERLANALDKAKGSK
jgi:phage terminase small subunit